MWEVAPKPGTSHSSEDSAPTPRATSRDLGPQAAPEGGASAPGSAGGGGGERAGAWAADAGLMSAMGLDASHGATAAAGAEYAGADMRARVGQLAEGSHPGVRKGGGGGKRRIGNIAGGTFVRTADPQQQGGGAGAQTAQPTAATGAESDRAFVGTRSSNLADRTTSDGTTSVRMEDESDAQATVIAAAVTRAREILDNAISQVASPTAPKVAAALQANFQSTEAKTATEVASKLQKIRDAFNGTIPIEVEGEPDGTTRAYVYLIWSDIHLLPPWFADPSADARARTIIHECSHKYTGTDDKAYHWDTAKYGGLSTKDALNNADSFAWFCMDVL